MNSQEGYETKHYPAIVGTEDIIKPLCDQLRIPSECNRIVLDIKKGQLVNVHFTCNCDEELLDKLVEEITREGRT